MYCSCLTWSTWIYLSDNSTLQSLDRADATTLGNQLTNLSLAQLLNDAGIESNLKAVGGGESGLEHLPNLLLGVENALRLALPSLKVDTLTGLGAFGRSDQLNGALVVVNLTLLEFGRCGEDHGARLDASHLDGLEVGHNDDLAALHLLEGNKAVEAGADGSADLALVLGGIFAGGIAHGDGGNEKRVGIRVVDGLEDVTNTEVDQAGGQRSSGSRGLLGLGGLLLLLLLGLVAASSAGHSGLGLANDLLGLVLDLLGLFLGAVGKSGLASGSGGSSSLLLLEALLFGLCVNGRLDIQDLILVNRDLLLVLQLQAEDGGVLDEINVAHNVGEALLAGALLGSPLGNEGSEGLVDGDIGLAGLAAEERRAAGQVAIEGLEDLGLVVGGLEAVRGGEPLLDLGLLGGSVLLGAEGGHCGGDGEARAEARRCDALEWDALE